jgi:hypothetical protein
LIGSSVWLKKFHLSWTSYVWTQREDTQQWRVSFSFHIYELKMRPRRGWEGNITLYLREVVWLLRCYFAIENSSLNPSWLCGKVRTGFIWLRTGTGGGLLWTQ